MGRGNTSLTVAYAYPYVVIYIVSRHLRVCGVMELRGGTTTVEEGIVSPDHSVPDLGR